MEAGLEMKIGIRHGLVHNIVVVAAIFWSLGRYDCFCLWCRGLVSPSSGTLRSQCMMAAGSMLAYLHSDVTSSLNVRQLLPQFICTECRGVVHVFFFNFLSAKYYQVYKKSSSYIHTINKNNVIDIVFMAIFVWLLNKTPCTWCCLQFFYQR